MIDLLEFLLIRGWAALHPRPSRSAPKSEPAIDDNAIGYLLGGDGETGKPVYLPWSDLVRMLLVTGITGSGKSTFMKRLVESLWPSVSIVLFDVHADFGSWLLRFAAATIGPDEAAKRLIVIDPAAPSNYITPVNPLAGTGEPLQIALFVLAALKKQAHDQFGSWGVTIQENLTFSVLALAEAGRVVGVPFSLAHLQAFFLNEAFRTSLVVHTSDMVREYWSASYARLSADKQLQSWLAVQNKVTPLLLPLGSLVGPRHGFAFDVLNEPPSKIVICTIARHRYEDAAIMGVDLVVNRFSSFVMSRAEMPPEEKLPVLAIVDEFPLLQPERFESLIALARKHNVAVALGAQSVGMLNPATRHILRNVVGNAIVMRQGPDGAREMARSIFPADPSEDVLTTLLTQKQGEAYLSQVDKPAVRFRVRHAPDPDVSDEAVQATLEAALRAYGQPRSAYTEERAAFARELARMEAGEPNAAYPPQTQTDPPEIDHGRRPGEYSPHSEP